MQAITPLALDELLQKGEAIVLDIRDEGEFNREHIPGALLLPAENIDAALQRTFSGKLGVFYCSSGLRTKDAESKIDASGLSDPMYLSGGINAWSKQGLPTVGGDARKPSLSIPRQVQISIALILLLFAGLSLTGSIWPIYVIIGVGLGLLVAGLSGTCAMASIIMLMPWNRRH